MVAFLSKSDATVGFDQIVDFLNAQTIQYALVFNPTIYVSCIKQFWATAAIKKVNDDVQLRALIEDKKVVVIEDFIRRDLHLDDVDGVECFPNEEIFAELARMGGCIQIGGKIEAIYADKDITLVDIKKNEEVVTLDAKPYGRITQEEVNVTSKGVNAARPTVFDDEEVTMTMAKTLIKIKAKKAKLLDEQIAQKLDDQEVQKAAARDKQENDDLERAQVLQKEGMTYDKVRPICEREYKKVQTLFKPDKDVEEPKKKRVAEETLLQESFKKLKVVKFLGFEFTQEIEFKDPKEISEKDVQNMLEIIRVSKFKVKALQVKYPIIDWEIHTEEKDYPLSNGVMILMLSGKLQVEEDNEMARDLVMKIFMEANKPKSGKLKKMHQGINAVGSSITAAGSRLMLVGKVDTAAEVIEEFTL
nr:hypothetical protein [Tanacetum cinerariifolium]